MLNFLKSIFFKKPKVEKIIVGLGNYSPKYENTRHNAGFAAIDNIAKRYNVKMKNKKFDALCGIGKIKDVCCLLLKPTTLMNNSGESLYLAKKYYNIDVKDILVLVDDIYFSAGKIRIKKNGGHAGHNGIKSIIYSIDDENFCRIKIGVGIKPNKNYDLAKWVLCNFSKEENIAMQKAYENVLTATELIISGNVEKAMNIFN